MVLSVFDNTTVLPDTIIRTNEMIQAYIDKNDKIVLGKFTRILQQKNFADIAAAEESGNY